MSVPLAPRLRRGAKGARAIWGILMIVHLPLVVLSLFLPQVLWIVTGVLVPWAVRGTADLLGSQWHTRLAVVVLLFLHVGAVVILLAYSFGPSFHLVDLAADIVSFIPVIVPALMALLVLLESRSRRFYVTTTSEN